MATPAIDAVDLVKTYSAGRKNPPLRALDGLTVSVPEGVVLGLLGPNGAGKSTTVKILTTLSRADSGTARVAGYDVNREQDQVRHAIGYVPQKSSSDPMATGIETLCSAVASTACPGQKQYDARPNCSSGSD
ncbi:MAG TPA: ATP-binding cassette domain-containing protein [Kribbella sp.]